jgi:hypothetical protein
MKRSRDGVFGFPGAKNRAKRKSFVRDDSQAIQNPGGRIQKKRTAKNANQGWTTESGMC